jgi:hypothetical protein
MPPSGKFFEKIRCRTQLNEQLVASLKAAQVRLMRVHPNPPIPVPVDIRPPNSPGNSGKSAPSDSITTSGPSEAPTRLSSLDSTSLDSTTPGPAGTSRSNSIGSSSSAGGVRGQADSGPNDSVVISGPSAALVRLSAQRGQRLESLSAAVSGGTYNVSSSAISSAMVAQALQ